MVVCPHQNQNDVVQFNKQYHTKVLFSSFHLNGHTSSLFRALKVKTTNSKQYHMKVLPNGFDLNGEFCPKTEIFETHEFTA